MNRVAVGILAALLASTEACSTRPERAVLGVDEAVYLMRDAVLNGGFTRAGVKSYLDRLIKDRVPIEGVGSRYTLGTDHDARRSIYIVEARGGTHHFLKTVDVN